MKKRILALLLSVIMVVGLLPTTALAAGATGTWAVKLHVSENSTVQYNEKSTLELGFGIQSDDLKLRNLQGIVFVVDLELFDIISKSGKAITDTEYTKDLSLTKLPAKYVKESASFYSEEAEDDITWKTDYYFTTDTTGKIGYVVLQASQGDDNCSVRTELILSKILFGLKSGKTVADIKSDSIRLATKEEAKSLNQSQVVIITDGDKNLQEAGKIDGKADTLTVTPAISWDGISVDGTPETNSYTVTFAANGGSGEMAAVTVPKAETGDTKYTTPTNGGVFTAPSGKAFQGWEDADGNAYVGGYEITLTEDIALKAMWATPVNAMNFTLYAYSIGTGITTAYIVPDTAAQAALYKNPTGIPATGNCHIGTGYNSTNGVTGRILPPSSELFAADTTYYLGVTLEVDEDYSFSGLTTDKIKLNGKAAEAIYPMGDGCAVIYVVFKLDPLTAAHEHSFGAWVDEVPATCTTPGTKGHKDCTGCGKHFDSNGNEITDLTIAVDPSNHADALGTTWKKNDTHHWHEYPCCGAKADEAAHTYTDDADTTCDTCGYVRTIAHVHSFGEWVNEVPATCKTTGTKGHKDCTGCGKHFDSSGNEITDLNIAVDPSNHADALGTTWKKNDTHHWHEYPCCGAKADEAAHTFADDATTCSAGCGQTRKLDQTITASNVTVTYGDTTAKINATAKTTPYYEVISGNDVISVNSVGSLTLHKAGTATVRITANGNDTYNAAEAITVTVTVAKKEIEIFTASATGRPYEAGNRNVEFAGASFADKSSETIHLTKGVDYTGTAVMDDDTANEGGKPVTITITLIGTAEECYELKSSTYSSFVSIHKIAAPDPTGLTGRIGNKLSTVSLPEGWAWVNGNTYMTQNEAQYEVTYTGTVNYRPWTEGDGHKLTVTASNKLPQIINIPDIDVTYGDTNVSIAPTGIHGTVIYGESSDVVDVDANGNVTILKAGTATISVTTLGDTDYDLARTNVTINVSKKALTVTANSPSIYVGEALPELTGAYTVSGLVNSDTVDVSLAYAAAPDTTKAGSYDIIVTATVDTDKYELTTVNGTLTIKARDIIYVPPVIAPTPASANSITVAPSQNGTAAADRKSASAGTTVTITTAPSKGYELESLTVLDANGRELPLSDKGNGRYAFQMPASNVTVAATFAESNAMLNFFVDVPADAYYAEAVLWAAENGITGGVDEVHFAPDGACTRAQIVTFLWRAAGSPEPKTTSDFTDVPAAAYYAKAVAWAVENGITGGVGDGKFAPDATCTRAQAVTFLFRAAGSPTVEQLAAFGDVAEDAYYAEAVAWAAENGITGGIGGGLFGSGDNCTRAQIVTFLYRSVK